METVIAPCLCIYPTDGIKCKILPRYKLFLFMLSGKGL